MMEMMGAAQKHIHALATGENDEVLVVGMSARHFCFRFSRRRLRAKG